MTGVQTCALPICQKKSQKFDENKEHLLNSENPKVDENKEHLLKGGGVFIFNRAVSPTENSLERED